MSGGFQQELAIITRAYNQAQQGLQSTSQSLGQVQKAADQAAASSGKLNTAFAAAMQQANGFKQTASGLYVPLSQVADAEKKVAEGAKQAGQAVEEAAKGTKRHKDETKSADDALQDFYQTLGALGVLRGFQVAIQGLINNTREYNAAITQAGLISEDYTGALNRAAMAATQGMYGPQELAQVYRDLGSAGLNANSVIAATPDVLQFATAAMIDEADAAQAVIAAASSFQIPFAQADRITNAFAEAMNRTTLGGRDLTFALASIGPVAGLAGQGLGQTLAAVAALRNAGAQAQDAATSVRAAILHLTAPTTEASDLMRQLGINIFDARGQMKQWSDIVGEFERALAPYNQQARNMALTTILGSDGIRAISSSMQMGSQQLAELASQFENADGSAARMADTMAETLDGAIRRVNGNAQRAAIIVGGDLQPAIISIIGFLDTLVNGFIHLDEGTRKWIEAIVGGAGLVAALSSLAHILQTLKGLGGLSAILSGTGAGATAAAAGAAGAAVSFGSVITIVGLLAAALGVGYLAWRTYQSGQEQAALAGADHAQQLQGQAERLKDLRDELEKLQAKSKPTTEEQDRMRQIASEIAKIAPEAAQGINLMTGAVTDMGKVLDGTNSALARMLSQSQALATASATAAQARLPQLRQEAADLERRIAGVQDRINAGILPASGSGGKFVGQPQDPIAARAVQGNTLMDLVDQLAAKQGEIADAESYLSKAQTVLGQGPEAPNVDDYLIRHRRELTSTPATTSGRDLPTGNDEKPSSWMSAWKAGLQDTLSTLHPFLTALSGVSGELDILNAKQTYYLAMLSDGRAGVEALAGAENARVQIVAQLQAHQGALHDSNEAARAMLQTLAAKQRDLDQQLAAGKIKAADYAEASGQLRTETERLTSSVSQNATAWWRDEQAIADAEAAAGKAQQTLADAQQKISDKVYESATGQMRHEVAMKRLSVDQQIDLVKRMLKEMALTSEQSQALQEQLIGLYGQRIEKEAGRIQTAYNDTMDKVSSDLETSLNGIDERLKSTIDPLKQQLKDLEGQDRQTDRARAEADHNKKLADLQKERGKEALRLGSDHQEKLRQIDSQIADENQRWQREQDDWTLDDKKRGIQDQIDAAEEGAKAERETAQDAAKKQRKDLEDHFKKVKTITESGILDSIAALAATDPQWFATGQGMIDQLIAGLETGDFTAVMNQIEGVRAAAEQAGQAAQQSVATTRQALIDQLNDQIDRLHADWFGAATPDQQTNLHNQAEVLRKQVIDLGGQVRTPAYATGAWEIPGTQIATLHQGETVLPAYAAEAFREFAPAVTNLPAAIEALGQRLIAAILSRPAGEMKVYGAENAIIEDPVDVDMLGRGVARQVSRIVPNPIGG